MRPTPQRPVENSEGGGGGCWCGGVLVGGQGGGDLRATHYYIHTSMEYVGVNVKQGAEWGKGHGRQGKTQKPSNTTGTTISQNPAGRGRGGVAYKDRARSPRPP